ncbi:hypothetical protein P4B35_00165 [Pontiellaceae bacterium B12227]|nr:hypothetical protein [Pontiellaceae bacterium B12227]
MTDQLKSYLERYTQLEGAVRELIARKGNSLCAQCSCICCDAVMCVEAIKSPFLKLIHQQADQYDEEKGFLSSTGCRLEKGRPSVCYEYFCDDHFYFQPDELHEEVLRIIGSLLFHATRNAQGEIPLDEITEEDQLDSADFQTLEKNLNESFRALEIIQEFYRTGSITDESHSFLKSIRIPEEFQ